MKPYIRTLWPFLVVALAWPTTSLAAPAATPTTRPAAPTAARPAAPTAARAAPGPAAARPAAPDPAATRPAPLPRKRATLARLRLDPRQSGLATDTKARLAFLFQRLDAGQRNLKAWWISWMVGYSLLTLGQGITAFLTHRFVSDRDDARALRNTLATGAITSVIGVVFTGISYPASFHGSRSARALQDGTPEGDARALARAEAMLRATAKSEAFGRSWLSHAGGFLINVAAGLVLWLAFDQPEDGFIQLASGAALAQLQIHTQPYRAIAEWEEYRRRFGGGPSHASLLRHRPAWGFSPYPAGLGVWASY